MTEIKEQDQTNATPTPAGTKSAYDMTHKPYLLLLDGDVLMHRIGRASERKMRWEDGVWSWFADEKEASMLLDNYVQKLMDRFDTDKIIMTISSKTNFRHEVFEDYKKSRGNVESYEPLLKGFLRKRMLKNWESYMIPGLEADDVMGILMTDDDWYPDHQKVIGTIDKDLDTVPGTHFNLTSEEEYNVTLEEANAMFYKQCLMGDRIDDIPGCPTYGEKTAEKALAKAEPGKEWETIVKCYNSKNLDEDYALTQARLVRILRSSDFDYDTMQPILWRPE